MKRSVYVACMWLFDENLNLTFGGSQRYTLELSSFLKDEGYRVTILQKSFRNFNKEVRGIPVKGIKTIKSWLGLYHFSYKIRQETSKNDLVIYVYQESGFPFLRKKSIAIQHGLNWSGSDLKKKFLNTYVLQPFLLSRFQNIVCVDTAYINWVHTQINKKFNYKKKLIYIPNFVQNYRHKNKAEWKESDNEKVVLFPRRMVKHRGALLAYEAMKILWEKKNKKYKIVFCGPGPLTDDITNDAFIHGFSNFIEIYTREFEEMPEEYSKAQVAVIPTLEFEGTSLSCIEAMSTGLPVITTHIGGLGNLVIPDFNGKCIGLSAEKLADAIEEILTNKKEWNKLSKNGIQTSEKLDIQYWKLRWKNLLKEKK